MQEAYGTADADVASVEYSTADLTGTVIDSGDANCEWICGRTCYPEHVFGRFNDYFIYCRKARSSRRNLAKG
jgi:hypothetical protein